MQCELCKIKAATVHLTEIVDGQRTESHLCQACAQKEGISIKSQLSLNELLSSLIAAHQQTTDGQDIGGEAEKSCPVCGITMDMFRKQAVLGCPNDYEVFGKTLEQKILLPLRHLKKTQSLSGNGMIQGGRFYPG